MFCVTWCNRKQFWIVPTEYIYAFLMILKINSIKQLVFALETVFSVRQGQDLCVASG